MACLNVWSYAQCYQRLLQTFTLGLCEYHVNLQQTVCWPVLKPEVLWPSRCIPSWRQRGVLS